jgi:GTP-binding protein
MIVKSAEFIASNTDYTKCPLPNKPEYAFIGRSNVGKSSLINKLVDNKSLAKTSAKPGKTQLINHFLVNEKWYLVDLPGYGWAKVSKEKKADFNQMTEEYLINRENLLCLFVLIDIRLEPQQIDLDFLAWAGSNEIPLTLVFTKADKVKLNEKNRNVSGFMRKLNETWETPLPYLVTSAENGLGKEEVLKYIDTINQGFTAW